MDDTLKKQVRDFVAVGKIDKAINLFLSWTEKNNPSLSNNLILLNSQYAELQRHENLGIISRTDSGIKRNQITNTVLTLLSDVDASAEETELPKPPPVKETIIPPSMSNIVLFMASNPLDTAALQLSKEFDAVFSTLQNSPFTVKKEGNVTYRKLQTTILKNKPRILHFSGHGLGSGATLPSDERTRAIMRLSKSGLVLEDEQRNAKILETRQLRSMFQIFSEASDINIDIVVLNACYSEEQAKAIADYVNYVIGMNDAIGDDSAIAFAQTFYENLAIADNVESAFRFAKLAIDIEGLKEEHKPVLLKKK